MSKKYLPIKVVYQKKSDTRRNIGGGGTKFFGEVTSELQRDISDKFSHILEFYQDVFEENRLVPAVGKITVKQEAIAKSHKPNDLCRKCPIIGGEGFDEIYIKLTQESIQETISLVNDPPTKRFKANLTAISDIQPIQADEKISESLVKISAQGRFDTIQKKIKLKLFDFGNEFDNNQIEAYVMKKLAELHLTGTHELITYGESIKYIKLAVSGYEDIQRIAVINGVKTIDFFRSYSLPTGIEITSEAETFLREEACEGNRDSEVYIGIIDGGISEKNTLLAPYVTERRTYIAPEYQNHEHATFIASIIQYGNELNKISHTTSKHFRFVDIIALPNNDPLYGPTDEINEESLMEVIEETMKEFAEKVKIWNVSIGISDQVCQGIMSDLGVFFDFIQDKYNVQFFVSSGNLNIPPYRQWPPQPEMGERDRIIAPADSVRAVTVGSIALTDSSEAIVKKNEPSPFSRRGPGANFNVKPDLVDYGGNLSTGHTCYGIGIKGLNPMGEIVEKVGTSYSNPRIVQKFASIIDDLVKTDLLLAKAILIHSARLQSRNFFDSKRENLQYYGFGMPETETQDILQCSEDEITLVFKQKISQGTYLELIDFPYPSSLIKDGKYYGEIGMTLAYTPILNEQFGNEYCQVNIDASFGTYSKNRTPEYKGEVPLERSWENKYEKSMIESGFKWSPIKSYYRKINNGITCKDGWKIRLDMTPRNNLSVDSQEFVLLVTIRNSQEPDGLKSKDIYTEVVQGFNNLGYVVNDLEIRQQIRQRQ